MLDTQPRAGLADNGFSAAALASQPADSPLRAHWHEGQTVLNLRGPAEQPEFLAAAAGALGLPLPLVACTQATGNGLRLVWAGPDDWFVIGPAGAADLIAARLRQALAGRLHALTDVSSGYTVLGLAGAPVREVLAQGCPLDLHPRVFRPGMCAGSHFFKTTVWLWRDDPAERFELLVRRSFQGYVGLMLARCTPACGLVWAA